ncbi:MAG: hypothetical protein QOJ92_2554 [Frankiales bacterium]|nr:hypothetical protein [Frankiales bacterium]
MTKTARTAAITAFVLGVGVSSPAAWAHSDKGGHDSKGAKHQSSDGSSADHKSGADEHKGSGDHGKSGGNDGEHNPPGNNGTVKIHQVAGDTSPHNVPHVTCDFYITFFGFDTNQTAALSLAGQAPTGKGVALWSKDDALISTDDAGGGKDVDEEFHVTAADLGLDRLGAPHPKQGYHVKLSVDVNGAPGGAKHKVFWIEPCGGTPPVSGVGGETGGTDTGNEGGGVIGGSTGNLGGGSTGTPGTGTGGTGTPGTGAVGGVNLGTTGSGSSPRTQVLGEHLTRQLPASSDTSGLGESTGLPFTGAPVIGLLAAGGAAAAAGALMVRAGRRREDTV